MKKKRAIVLAIIAGKVFWVMLFIFIFSYKLQFIHGVLQKTTKLRLDRHLGKGSLNRQTDSFLTMQINLTLCVAARQNVTNTKASEVRALSSGHK